MGINFKIRLTMKGKLYIYRNFNEIKEVGITREEVDFMSLCFGNTPVLMLEKYEIDIFFNELNNRELKND